MGHVPVALIRLGMVVESGSYVCLNNVTLPKVVWVCADDDNRMLVTGFRSAG